MLSDSQFRAATEDRMNPTHARTTDARTNKKIVILIGTHLCTNPRVIKEAETLAKAGYNVTVLGSWLDGSLKERDRTLGSSFTFVPVIDITEGGARRLALRGVSKLARSLYQFTHLETRWQ